jgi:O-antigen ligase
VKSAVWSRFVADLGSGSGRSSIWAIGVHAFLQRPVFGWGLGNFSEGYNRWLLQQYTPLFMNWDRAAHNLLVMIGVELGVVGLALLAWVIIEQTRALREIGRTHELYEIRVALEAALVGLLVMSFSLDTLYWKYAWLTFSVVVLARSAALAGADRRASASPVTLRRADALAMRGVMRA